MKEQSREIRCQAWRFRSIVIGQVLRMVDAPRKSPVGGYRQRPGKGAAALSSRSCGSERKTRTIPIRLKAAGQGARLYL